MASIDEAVRGVIEILDDNELPVDVLQIMVNFRFVQLLCINIIDGVKE